MMVRIDRIHNVLMISLGMYDYMENQLTKDNSIEIATII